MTLHEKVKGIRMPYLAGAGGFEPPTAGFGDQCSTKLSYAPASRLWWHDRPNGLVWSKQ